MPLADIIQQLLSGGGDGQVDPDAISRAQGPDGGLPDFKGINPSGGLHTGINESSAAGCPPGTHCVPGGGGGPGPGPGGPGPKPLAESAGTGGCDGAGGTCVPDDPGGPGGPGPEQCPPGAHFDPAYGGCIPDNALPNCPAGQHRDPSGTCVPDTPGGPAPCPTGQVRDQTGACVPAPTPTQCAGNRIKNPATGACDCPPGTTDNGTATCPPAGGGPGPGTHNCPPGTQWIDAPGAPGGGGCVPIGTGPGPGPGPGGCKPPASGCPAGQQWDSGSCKCVPIPVRPPIFPPDPGGTHSGGSGAGVPFGGTTFPLWVYTGDVNENVHQVPTGIASPGDTSHPGWQAIGAAASDVKPDSRTGLCPDGSKPNAAGICPQPGDQSSSCTTDYTCADGKSPLWDGTNCTCADGSAPYLKKDPSTPPGGTTCADGSTPDPGTGMCKDGTCPGGFPPINGKCTDSGGGGGGPCPDGSEKIDGKCRPPPDF